MADEFAGALCERVVIEAWVAARDDADTARLAAHRAANHAACYAYLAAIAAQAKEQDA